MPLKILAACAALLISFGAWAGSISFQLSLTGTRLTVTALGDSTAYYPEVSRMLADGRWQALATFSGAAPAAELLPGAQLDLLWPETPTPQSSAPIERLRPLMVRFFDQAGVGFGQISFLQAPPPASVILRAGYADGLLTVAPPGDQRIHATWILWAQEEGLAPILNPVQFAHRQPPARRIAWRDGMDPLRLATGAGQPLVLLLHETAQGLVLQTVAGAVVQGRQQRSFWLDASPGFYLLALLAVLTTVGVTVWRWIGKRDRTAASPLQSHCRTNSDGYVTRAKPGGLVDMTFTLVAASLLAATLGIEFLNSANSPTGGDSASHLLYAWLYADGLVFSGQIVPWLPEVFGGLPFLSYYFPLPFMVIAALSKLLGLSAAFKWGAFLAAMLLPGAVFAGSRRWLGMSWPAAFCGALGAFAFLLHEQNSIWGGNLLSTLAGEFAYSYGLLFAVLAMLAWSRALHLGRGWVVAALLEAACGFSHGFPLLVVGFSSFFLLLDGGQTHDRLLRNIGLLVRGHLLAFCLLGGWLWPMLEMHGLTIPNDAAFALAGWRDLLPSALWPVWLGGCLGLAALGFSSVRQSWGAGQLQALRFFASTAGIAALAFVAGDQLGLADIRFFPMVWLCSALVCGWLFGQALLVLGMFLGGANWRLIRFCHGLLAAAAALALLGWLGPRIQAAPDWALWNHSGLQAKPQWHNLSRLFPALQGDLWSPRLLFEHDPANNDIGSTRALEALPMFLNHRPVLEGLYMESALLGPVVYQLQSEVSARPSSPLVRFPSGSLDASFAARHMNFLYADSLLLRSSTARAAIEASGEFVKIAEAAPFAVYRLKHFDSRLAEVVTQPLRIRPPEDWMQDAFAWFRTRSRFEAELPVYTKEAIAVESAVKAPVRTVSLARNELVFESAALGQPHLIRIAYHPRWRLVSKGSLNIAGPGFMLVVPQEKEIRLVYTHTPVGWLGMLATLLAALYVLRCAWVSRLGQTVSVEPAPEQTVPGWKARGLPLLIGWGLLILAGAYFATRSPERVYARGWDALRANQYSSASEAFDRAYELRRPPAKKEEALFWSAKANELAGRRDEAKRRYRQLCERYHGYWLPESLYTLALLERLDGQATDTLARRLREEYPNNAWTKKLDEKK
ncbi:MAG: 6-pyruvoyl-tetrahydropterin synthase-related protein [Sterolibacterium sp.]|nr:6-pyruvoyl-tetrahydropterin synthase-related protein [Sterolibacterium sp.]